MPSLHFERVSILGGGAWGTALAATCLWAGRTVNLWCRSETVAASLSSGRGHPTRLDGLDLPEIPSSTDLSQTAGADIILSVVPAQASRDTLIAAAAHIAPGTPVVMCAKGVERGSLKLMADVLAETVPQACPAVLSGPSFAADVARGLPTAVTLACTDEAIGRTLVEAIGRPAFRPYWTSDLIGAEIGGAVKNVLAIACGITEGLGLGRSAHAALIARGFSELRRLALAMGARETTLSGLCGLGDLVLTCSSSQSRNMSLGLTIGQLGSADAALSAQSQLTEGVSTAPGVLALAKQYNIEMPICAAVADVLSRAVTVAEAIENLLDRPFTEEF